MKKAFRLLLIFAVVLILAPISAFGVYNLVDTKAEIKPHDEQMTTYTAIVEGLFNSYTTSLEDNSTTCDVTLTSINSKDKTTAPYLKTDTDNILCNIGDVIVISIKKGKTINYSGCTVEQLEEESTDIYYITVTENVVSISWSTKIGIVDIPSVG